ncbi:unnamed protein product [Periconia digitata]|uniref:Uncharacterized protein n=1 Tax=Periconia digitata TaxID=1303443 RepID=A0A9W4U459_9PLEO|nr:unnamed protein product [Periconia digitata]
MPTLKLPFALRRFGGASHHLSAASQLQQIQSTLPSMATNQASKQPGQIEITSLPVPQLQELKQQLDRELEHLTTSFQSLRTAQSKFSDCLKSIAQGVNTSTADKPLLVPLTSSLYVPGRLTSSTHVLIDIGTGFFVEKSTEDAADFYKRKVKDLGDSLKDLEQVVNSKANNVRMVEEVIRVKVLSAQEGGQKEAKGT